MRSTGSDRPPGGIVAVAFALVVWVTLASAAAGHAALISSEPAAGAVLDEPPERVTLEFTGPFIAGLSDATVTDPKGQEWTVTATSERRMVVGLDTAGEGVYVVTWKTVSPLDGHTLRGRFSFGVGVDPGAQPDVSGEPGWSDLVLAVPRVVEYLGLLAAVGCFVLRRLATRERSLSWLRIRLRSALVLALAGGVAVVVGETVLAVPELTARDVMSYLGSRAGLPRAGRIMVVAVALVAVVRAHERLAAAGAVAGLAGLAASGHAAAAGGSWPVAVQALHLITVGLWAGTILALATQKPPGGWRGEQARMLLARFSPIAIPAFVVTVLTGALRGGHELARVADLFRTTYGQVLLAKVLVVALMIPLSVRAWRHRAAVPRLEGALAVLALAATALLAAFPLPPQRLVELEPPDRPVSLPEEGDLTVGTDLAAVLLGITVRPGAPGLNDILVHLETSPRERAGELDPALELDHAPVELEGCGPNCRRGRVIVNGGEVLTATLEGESVSLTIPRLPAPDGAELLERVDQVMGGLERVRYDERFGPIDPPIESTMSMEAPERLHFVQHTTGRETLRVGDVIYRRDSPDEPWTRRSGSRLEAPTYVWDEPERIAPGIWGEDTVDGVETQVLAFYVDHATTPIWYRLWVDGDGLVRRAEMRARAHFMDHSFYDFDGAFTITEPPPQEVAESDQ